jgi:phosphoglycolate phosphatase-like HAD superfamily hydrolase
MSPSVDFEWLRWVNPRAKSRLGRIRHALFDFDGTISTLRQGWEEVMVPMMIAEISPYAPADGPIAAEVREYVDRSTGILTIRQMEWLAQAVARHGLNGAPKKPLEYKADYLNRLMVRVKERLALLESGAASPEEFSIAGSIAFAAGLAARGAKLYLASGTDHHFVLHEANALGLLGYFPGGVFGALDESEAHSKDRVIQEILDRHLQTAGNSAAELLVVGDGTVELREAAVRGALALGVASDEVRRCGWNEHKVPRLVNSGADLLVADFRHAAELVALLTGTG